MLCFIILKVLYILFFGFGIIFGCVLFLDSGFRRYCPEKAQRARFKITPCFIILKARSIKNTAFVYPDRLGTIRA
jgi:hypothetical protein